MNACSIIIPGNPAFLLPLITPNLSAKLPSAYVSPVPEFSILTPRLYNPNATNCSNTFDASLFPSAPISLR